MTNSTPILKLNLSKVIEDIFMVLSDKEKEVVVKRFSLDNQPRQTLESIGRSFNVTRERIRQIENIALGKLKRTVQGTKLRFIHELSEAVLREKGGIMLEEDLIQAVLNAIENTFDVDAHIVRLALTICPGINSIEKNNLYRLAWHLDSIDAKTIKSILDAGVKTLKSNKDVLSEAGLTDVIKKAKSLEKVKLPQAFYSEALKVDMRIKKVQEGWGLMTWRHVHPKSIRDKALIVLRREEKPMHFVDIAKRIAETKFDHKRVTDQAVHNELIRYKEFVLVGRGLYALKEWGYTDGTVTDVIEGLLKKKSPMTKQEIIKGVLKQRQVKKGTISLNLQKHPQFVRVGRAVYAYEESKKA